MNVAKKLNFPFVASPTHQWNAMRRLVQGKSFKQDVVVDFPFRLGCDVYWLDAPSIGRTVRAFEWNNESLAQTISIGILMVHLVSAYRVHEWIQITFRIRRIRAGEAIELIIYLDSCMNAERCRHMTWILSQVTFTCVTQSANACGGYNNVCVSPHNPHHP